MDVKRRCSRSPLGLRGLKFVEFNYSVELSYLSQPTRAAWIEICLYASSVIVVLSQPSWAAWIEILSFSYNKNTRFVAALLGCVD